MRIISTLHKQAFVYTGLLTLLALAFIFSACGAGYANGGSSGSPSGSTPTTAPTATPTSVKGYGTSHGCPSDAVVSSAPAKANVVVKPTNVNSTINARVGDVVEVQLPFGHKWGGPKSSPQDLQMQSPAGYASTANNACMWRFNATSAGNTTINYTSQALCKLGQVCPMYILELSFKVNVK